MPVQVRILPRARDDWGVVMEFSEAVKLEAKRRSHYVCVVCRQTKFLDVHHILPQAEDGPATLDNAAPLCVECHDLYGGDPGKRKWVREARDYWWDYCAKQASNPTTTTLLAKFDALQTDVAQGRRDVADLKAVVMQQLASAQAAVGSAQTVAEISQATAPSGSTQLAALRRFWPVLGAEYIAPMAAALRQQMIVQQGDQAPLPPSGGTDPDSPQRP